MKKQSGFTLIEMLIVVAIIGIIASIAIPNLLDAIERAKQKRGMSDIRSTIIAMQAFGVDFGGYPYSTCNGTVASGLATLTDLNGDTVIVPSLIQSLPTVDAWGAPYMYFGGPDGTAQNATLGKVVALHFVVYSLGSDMGLGGGTDGSADALSIANAWCQSPQPAIPGIRETHCYQSDIVWGDSSFEQSPDGKQRKC